MHPENTKYPKDSALNMLSTVLFYTAIFVFIVALAFPHNPPAGNWEQQFLPPNGNRPITDITFLDSLNGYAVQSQDSSFILRTTTGGDNWFIIYKQLFAMTHVQFLNINTGYAGGGYLYKTTNAGFNWTQINTPATTVEKIFVLNENTIWFVSSDLSTGGTFFTANGGANWIQQYSSFNTNPDRIYMYNARIGFTGKSTNGSNFRRTTNGGASWDFLSNSEGLIDMFFADSLTGWKSGFGGFKKTTNGGLNWVAQITPSGGNIIETGISSFNNIYKDTIWGVGSTIIAGSGGRGMILRTTNGGDNWLFQVPDTSINIYKYMYIDFVKPLIGWAYNPITGIHTTNGGDTTFFLPVNQISSEIPNDYKLFQNYPNPFNPVTNINYQIAKSKFVKLIIYDVQGKEVAVLVNEEQSAGTYEVDWNGAGFSSGIYFYSLIIDNKLNETRKMLMVK